MALGLASAIGLATALLACSGSSRTTDQSAGVTVERTVGVALRSTAPVESTEPLGDPSSPSSPNAISPFAVVIGSARQYDPDLAVVVQSMGTGRIAELAERSCVEVDPELTAGELANAAYRSYDRLSSQEQTAVDLDGWVLVYGALVGAYCPDRLPLAAVRAGPSPDADDELGSFRAVLPELRGLSRSTLDFALDLSDDRIQQLSGLACAATDAGSTPASFWADIDRSHRHHLTDDERASIDRDGYGELYGAMVGWFCSANVPR